MNTSKKAVRLIAETCRQLGICKVVFSPGSRSAPLVIAFSAIPEIESIVIPDERVAGYFALGIAQQLHEPVAVVCTSGTAVLNLGPAVTEAFYQKIPLLLLTADRPDGAVAKGENQSINQAFLFRQLTKGSYDINGDASGAKELSQIAENISKAIHQTRTNGYGPVHLNIRLSEPLYNLSDETIDAFSPLNSVIEKDYNKTWAEQSLQKLKMHFARVEKKLVIVGMRNPDKNFVSRLQILANRKDLVILTESTSNLSDLSNAIDNYDACLELINETEAIHFVPDLVITLGNQIISKRIRQFLRKYKPQIHFDIAPGGEIRANDLFDLGTQPEYISENEALDCLINCVEIKNSEFSSHWQSLYSKAEELTNRYLSQVEFSDFKIFQTLINSLPNKANIQYGNSTPIRYSNFFKHHPSLKINSNRGTSGIDGCLSTSAGAAYANKQLTINVIGDVSFFYDSNALFHNYLSPLLRIIIINNSGGNIFRLIDGPDKIRDFEKFFETKHHLSARHIALMYDLPYYFCQNEMELGEILGHFYGDQNGKPAILEIKTDGEKSARGYKEYFTYLHQNKSH